MGFFNLPKDEQRLLLQLGDVKEFRKNQVVIKEGEVADSLFILLSGEVVVMKHDAKGHALQLGNLKRGAIFGEVAMLAQTKRTASVFCYAASKIIEIEKKSLMENRARFSSLWITLATILALRLNVTTQQVSQVAFLTVAERLQKVFEGYHQEQRKKALPSHLELAEAIGTSREVVSRSLKKLVERSILYKKGRRYFLP